MGGKKGGLLDSVGNATGLKDAVGGSLGYLIPGAGLARVAYENTIKPMNEAKRKMKQEKGRQIALQAENERMEADRKMVAEKGQGLRQARARQRSITAANSGRAATIATSPLGAGAPAMTDVGTKKTLLGE